MARDELVVPGLRALEAAHAELSCDGVSAVANLRTARRLRMLSNLILHECEHPLLQLLQLLGIRRASCGASRRWRSHLSLTAAVKNDSAAADGFVKG